MCDLVRRDTLCLKGAELPLKGYSQLLVSLLYMHVKTLYQSAVLQLPSAVMQTYWARSALPSAIMRPFQAVAQMTGLTLTQLIVLFTKPHLFLMSQQCPAVMQATCELHFRQQW